MRTYVLTPEPIATSGVVYVGLDVHKATISATTLNEDGEIVHRATFGAELEHLDHLVSRLCGARVRVAYEAGPCGFGVARHLRSLGCEVLVAAPSKIPSASGDRVKTDKRDSLKLAELLRAGLLKAVRIPTVEEERHRELARTRDQLVRARRRCYQQLRAKLLYHGIALPEDFGDHSWSEKVLVWLDRVRSLRPGDGSNKQRAARASTSSKLRPTQTANRRLRRLSLHAPLRPLPTKRGSPMP